MSVAVPTVPATRLVRIAPLWVVLAVALVARLALVVLTPHYELFGDAGDYHAHAVHLVQDGDYPPSIFAAKDTPSALRPPGFPYLLAGLYEVFGVHVDVGRIAGAFLGTSTVWFTHAIARRVWGARIAIWAAGTAAVMPTLVALNGGLVAENLYVPLVMAAVWAAVRHRDAGRGARWALAAGALIGLATLTRTNGAILVLPLLVAAWLPHRRWTHPVALLVGFALAMAPWTVRNAVELHGFLPLGTQAGFTMSGTWNSTSNVPGSRKGAWVGPFYAPETKPFLLQGGTTEAQVDAELRRAALRYAGDHPGYVATATGYHALQLFQLWPHVQEVSGLSFREQGLTPWTWKVLQVALWPFLALAAWGAVLLLRRRRSPRGPAWMWSIPVLVILSVVPLLGPPRYRVPVDPFLAILTAIALVAAVDRFRARRGSARRAPTEGDGDGPGEGPSGAGAVPA